MMVMNVRGYIIWIVPPGIIIVGGIGWMLGTVFFPEVHLFA
jgi:hypothetical protein